MTTAALLLLVQPDGRLSSGIKLSASTRIDLGFYLTIVAMFDGMPVRACNSILHDVAGIADCMCVLASVDYH